MFNFVNDLDILHDFNSNIKTTDNINLFFSGNIYNNYNLKEKEKEKKMLLFSNSTEINSNFNEFSLISNDYEFNNEDESGYFKPYLREKLNLIDINDVTDKKVKIFDINKVSKGIVKGRPKKNYTGEKKHNYRAVDNASKSIIITASKIIYDFLEEHTKLFSKEYKRKGFKIPRFKTNGHLLGNSEKKQKFFETSVKELFFDVQTDIGLTHKRKLQKLLKYELNNDNIKEKHLNFLFNLPFGFYLKKILNDEDIVIDGKNYKNNKYQTLKDMFNSGDKVFTGKEKQTYKAYIMKILNYKILTRKRKIK